MSDHDVEALLALAVEIAVDAGQVLQFLHAVKLP